MIRKLIELPGVMYKRREMARELAGFFASPGELAGYRREIREMGLVEELQAKQATWQSRIAGESARGRRYIFGAPKIEEVANIYAVVRKLKPRVAVETGVCNGLTSAFILAALDRNREGRLYSIDFPEIAGEQYPAETFWDGKAGAVIPPGETSGWIIPDRLRGRWQLVLGRSQDKLPPLLGDLREIDFYLHDGEHSYECMTFEFTEAYRCLRRGGVLMTDDTDWNQSFQDFAREHDRDYIRLSRKIWFLQK
jgi:predicted O-methyltransferase YrrM